MLFFSEKKGKIWQGFKSGHKFAHFQAFSKLKFFKVLAPKGWKKRKRVLLLFCSSLSERYDNMYRYLLSWCFWERTQIISTSSRPMVSFFLLAFIFWLCFLFGVLGWRENKRHGKIYTITHTHKEFQEDILMKTVGNFKICKNYLIWEHLI